MLVKAKRIGKRGGSTGLIAAGILLCLVYSLPAKQVGKFSYYGAPEDFNTAKFHDTVTVSDTMVALAEKIYVKDLSYLDSIVDTPSIFFIIDHSTSMSYHGGMNDQNGNRFVVTSAFIDSIAKRFPSAEVGIGIFKGFLHYRAGDSPYFTALPKSYDRGGAYLPLRKLNGTYTGQTGTAILKSFLAIKMIPVPFGGGMNYAELTYTPSTWPAEGTNINIGFESAKKAFRNSTRPPASHYIVFLSDGDENDNYSDDATYFEHGDSVATTFTIFFTQGTTVPGTIRRMTENIRVNGYSLSNPKSNYWPFFNSKPDSLMKFLMTNVLTKISVSTQFLPKQLAISGQTASAWIDSTFTFNSLFPLLGRITPFNFKITYSSGKADSTHTINFFVKTQAGFVMPAKDFEIKLWDRDIEFRYNNVPISQATETMSPIALSFPWNGGTAQYVYRNVSIHLYSVVPPIDSETIPLLPGAGVFNGSFQRLLSDIRTPGNSILEHALTGDTIVAVFRNNETPKLPLDTLRVPLPLKITPFAVLISAITRDLDADGYLDHIEMLFNRKTTIPSNAGSSFSVQHNGIDFPVDSIIKLDTSWYSLCLRQHAEPSPLETSWKPSISIAPLTGLDTVKNFPTTDGAPPVIFTAIKKIVDFDNRTTDTVTVTFSEKISGKDGNPFSITNQPVQTFYIWIKENATTFIRIDNMLDSIPSFVRLVADSVVVFVMTNGHNLDTNHWINILTPAPLLSDKPINFPTDLNRKVRIQVVNMIPPSGLDSAVTRDSTGNGCLDHIELYFDRYTDLAGAAPSSFTVRYDMVTPAIMFPVVSITKLSNRSYSLRLTEQDTIHLQTSWRPVISVGSLASLAIVNSLRCLDGAPPVIGTVFKQVVDAVDREKDTVTVTMSEKIFAKNGSPFSIGTAPEGTFYAWTKENSIFLRDNLVLNGITYFVRIIGDSTLVFSMRNRQDLTNNHWMNIQTIPGVLPLLCDRRFNFPTDSNRKVRVIVNHIDPNIKIFPNPSQPTAKEVPAGEFYFKHEKDALKWVYNDNAGVVIALKSIMVPPKGTDSIAGAIKIYDVVGNLVTWASTGNIFKVGDKDISLGVTCTEVHIYWNGFNKSKMAVGAGTYRVVVYLNYPADLKDVRLITKAGICR